MPPVADTRVDWNAWAVHHPGFPIDREAVVNIEANWPAIQENNVSFSLHDLPE